LYLSVGQADWNRVPKFERVCAW